MKIKAQIAMVINLDKCIGCHTCSVTCKNTWTNRSGAEYMWFNNVETKPGAGYPDQWEDQQRYKGGWHLRKGQLTLRSGFRWQGLSLSRIFYNPNSPTIDDYYEPWTYDYQKLLKSPVRRHMPTARPQSLLTGEYIEKLRKGPNWDDDLAGGPQAGGRDPNLRDLLGEEVRLEFEKAFMLYLPRLCEHCLNPGCVASCPSGAIYKRDEDGIVLVDQEKCRGWRYCTSGCPYKKVYYNWKTYKAEKCTFCYPRVEEGVATVCSETCPGRLRYMGVLLYDADRVPQAAAQPDEQALYQAQLELFLDPHDPAVIAQARRDGIQEDWLAAAQKSPVYKLAVQYGLALPLHPEFRTLPMVWYIPPLSPMVSVLEFRASGSVTTGFFPTLEQMRAPVQYLANFLTGGNPQPVERALRRLLGMRHFMRSLENGQENQEQLLETIGLSEQTVRHMYRLLAVAKYEDRIVIPLAHREESRKAHQEQGKVGYAL
ncbi:nitrate reductase subunit beta [Desulfitobacterium chlororespirans]|uniref:Respiratory nitrate reductase beta subunit n=1 Tax=Desulfitobacterium chlororespirans DSM 11544 TaxID=1121395 RepID=A0A1M7S5F1_9FIRM|nr:nitrate reductase subunit beta [Desulfitobacterium chlororespirans]SHN53857.1 respiratory nitrate reductase beta subunit [Desulfitobacterium chlororespirans DSM 11544]